MQLVTIGDFVAAPMTNLLKKGKKFIWDDQCQSAFEQLKAMLINQPVLRSPDYKKQFVLAVDACDTGIGAVL